MDWRGRIAEAARPELTENGCVLVAYDGVRPAEVVSRLYRTADYKRESGWTLRGAREVACGQQTRRINAGDGANYYVVQRHNGGITVWTGLHHVLIDLPNREAATC